MTETQILDNLAAQHERWIAQCEAQMHVLFGQHNKAVKRFDMQACEVLFEQRKGLEVLRNHHKSALEYITNARKLVPATIA